MVASCASLFCNPNDDAVTGAKYEEDKGADQPHHILDHLLQTKPLNRELSFCLSVLSAHSLDSISNYPPEGMDVNYVRRTRAKTPCLWIGQLEANYDENRMDPAEELASQYQDILPLRNFTPYPELEHFKPRKALRKVKGQLSLRDVVTCHRLSITSNASNSSDTDTLVGTPTSQISPLSGKFSFTKSEISEEPETVEITPSRPVSQDNGDVGFQICLDLLTNELATGLFKQHPEDSVEKASGLQILLMIEAYEAVKKQLCQSPKVTNQTVKMLDNWLAALYTLYDGHVLPRSSSFKSERRSVDISPLMTPRSKRSRRHSREFGDFQFDFEEGGRLRAWGARDERPK